MLTSDINERISLLQAEVDHLWRQAQRLGSGAAIHMLVNRISTARGALCLVEERQASLGRNRLDMLLVLAEESLHDARALIAQIARGRPRQ